MNHRYERHFLTPQIQHAGQQKLAQANVLVVGAGGLGTPLLGYLVGGGCGNITLVEYDTVDISNLHRQFFYKTTECGQPKGNVITQYLSELNPDIHLTLHTQPIQKIPDVVSLIKKHHIVVDATDNEHTKIFLHDQSYYAQVPLITASVRGFYGMITTYKGYLSTLPCYYCIHENHAYPSTVQGTLPVVGMTPGVFGSLQANEVFKEILSLESLAGKMLTMDLLHTDFHTHHMVKNPQCTFCGSTT